MTQPALKRDTTADHCTAQGLADARLKRDAITDSRNTPEGRAREARRLLAARNFSEARLIRTQIHELRMASIDMDAAGRERSRRREADLEARYSILMWEAKS